MGKLTLVVVSTTALRCAIANTLARVRVALPDADILVVDDDSTDDAADCVERLAAHLGHISVLRGSGSINRDSMCDPVELDGRARGYELVLTLRPGWDLLDREKSQGSRAKQPTGH